jgi:D-hydroxyproline dehydrogenase subunit gamma
MPSAVALTVNGISVEVAPGTTVAVAAMQTGQPCRISVNGTPRGPLCGMGICLECRMTINGISHRRTCQILCEPGMEVTTND